MPDLDVIHAIEKQIQEPLNSCEFDAVMSGNARCSYVLDAQQQVIALNLQNCNQTDLALLKQLKNLTHLNLSLNQITDLTALKKLEQLTCLNLQKNSITELSPLKGLTNLTLLNLQDNQVVDLKPLKTLKKLNYLNLQANQLENLKYLAELSCLTSLNLNSNHIKDLTALKPLKLLKMLYLSSNQLTEVEPLKDLEELIELDLRFNQITTINAVGQLNNLKRLYLSSNKIAELDALQELHSLTELYLSSNQISDISPLKELDLLTELDLRHNKISQIDAIANLSKLTGLYLENNQITEINSLQNLTELVFLNLRNNQISDIEPIKNLTKLNELYLSSNKIQDLPRWILDFNLKIKWNSGGEGISVIANPLKHPTAEIIRQGNIAIKAYFDELEQQQQHPLNEIKVCFVGDSAVGKTSLIKLLTEDNSNNQPSPTLGIEITQWHYQSIIAHCWDFGGDEKLRPTQSLFFSSQSVYVLVLDNRQQRNVTYWLRKISYLANDVPVLMVLNKCEEAESYDVDRENLARTYNSLQEQSFFSISCTQQLGIEEFKQSLLNTIKRQTLLKKLWPESWIRAKQAIEKQLQQHYYLSEQLYEDLCQQYGVKEKALQEQLAQLLHDLGVLVHLRKYNLPDTYLLESTWLIKSLYKIIFSNQIAENNAKLLLKNLPVILKANDEHDYFYTLDEYKDFINLMRKLGLCFLIDKTSILIPQLLDDANPEIESEEKILRFRIHYEYLDESIISRLIVELHDDIENEVYWRNGVLLKNMELNSEALVTVDYAAHTIHITISGENCRDYFLMIRNALRDIETSIIF